MILNLKGGYTFISYACELFSLAIENSRGDVIEGVERKMGMSRFENLQKEAYRKCSLVEHKNKEKGKKEGKRGPEGPLCKKEKEEKKEREGEEKKREKREETV